MTGSDDHPTLPSLTADSRYMKIHESLPLVMCRSKTKFAKWLRHYIDGLAGYCWKRNEQKQRHAFLKVLDCVKVTATTMSRDAAVRVNGFWT